MFGLKQCILEGIMVGLLFVKISRAKKRSRTLMFSNTAVINQRDGQLCLIFRIADMRKSHLLDATVRAAVISKRTTAEGEEITISHEELEVRIIKHFLTPLMMMSSLISAAEPSPHIFLPNVGWWRR